MLVQVTTIFLWKVCSKHKRVEKNSKNITFWAKKSKSKHYFFLIIVYPIEGTCNYYWLSPPALTAQSYCICLGSDRLSIWFQLQCSNNYLLIHACSYFVAVATFTRRSAEPQIRVPHVLILERVSLGSTVKMCRGTYSTGRRPSFPLASCILFIARFLESPELGSCSEWLMDILLSCEQ